MNLMVGMHRHYETYPWILKVSMGGRLYGARIMLYVEEILKTLSACGVHGMSGLLAYRSLYFHMVGSLQARLQLNQQDLDRRAVIARSIDPSDIPLLASLFDRLTVMRGDPPYEVTLHMVIDGVLGRSWVEYADYPYSVKDIAAESIDVDSSHRNGVDDTINLDSH